MIKSSKTPYEIRLDLLQLAFDILIQSHQARGAIAHEEKPKTSPSTEEVIAEAEKLNGFISKANNQ